LALLIANSPLARFLEALLELPVVCKIGGFGIAKPLLLWINDGLMAVFFLLVGLELKREVLEGHLSSLRQASLPIFAALGGMLAPAAVYVAFNRGDEMAMRGWAIPAATDIAFALGVLSLLGKRVPVALKASLLSIAVIDDLGAIVIIAAFYTAKLSWISLAVAGGLIACLAILNRAGVRRLAPYFLIGVPLWVAVLKSGVHATLAGVIVAMFIPLRTPERVPSPAHQLEHSLHPWVAFGILAVFALANAGVRLIGLSLESAVEPVPLGIGLGLLLGKQLGVLVPCWLATRWKLAALPDEVGWRAFHGMAVLCGIGFTMSLFIASLAFEDGGANYGGLERLGILGGSLISALLGYWILQRVLPAPGPEA
jgi:NhaA family Na+:H+ antiporter